MSTIAELGKTVYLDYAATTPLHPRVFELMKPLFGPTYGNPSSMYASGRRARKVVDFAREKAASVLGAHPEEIIFTGSGTESDNLAVEGVMRGNRVAGNHLIVSSIEHKAILESTRALAREGFDATYLPVDSAGLISVEDCVKRITDKTILVSVMYANNEIGTIEPIRALAEAITRKRGGSPFPLLHTDACQAAGALPIRVSALGVDLMTLNSSKIYGPKGVGLLYKRKGVRLDPLIVGGEQERGFRAGTESIALIAGFAEALLVADRGKEEESERLCALRNYFFSALRSKVPSAVLNGHKERRLPNNIHISVPHVEGESMVLMLDSKGIEVSTGSACSSVDLKPSHVLLAIGQGSELAHGSIRFTLGRNTTKDELDYVLSVFPGIVGYLSSVSALTLHPRANV